MNIKNLIPLLNAAAALSLLASASSCTKTRTDIGSGTGTYIEFSSALTKTPVNTPDDMSEFAVWAYYQAADGGCTDVFGQTSITVNRTGGSWTYDNPKMWKFGVTYTFYAVYPTDVNHVVERPASGDEKPFMKILDYDVTQNQDKDLLFAANENIRYHEGSVTAPVTMNFCHILSIANFTVRIDPTTLENLPDFEAAVTSAKLYGLPKECHFSAQDFDVSDMSSVIWEPVSDGLVTNASNPFIETKTPPSLELSTEEKNLFGASDLFVFPAASLAGYCLEINWTVTAQPGTEPIKQTQVIQLSASAVRSWIAGKRYKYTFTISDTDHILFGIPTVTGWDDASGGIIVVE